MPFAQISGTRLYYTQDGPADAPALVLSNSLGCDADMWSLQVPELSRDFRVLRYDTRGHGHSALSQVPFDFGDLAADVVGLMDHLSIDKAHFCGISMGGLTGIALTLDFPQRVDRLVLANTAARIGSAESWSARIALVQAQGLQTLAAQLVERWLSPAYRQAEPGMTQVLVDSLRRGDDKGYTDCCAALRDANLGGRVAGIAAPTLVVAGLQDAATTTVQGRELQQSIAHAQYAEIDASHISNWEQPAIFALRVGAFLRA